MASNPIKKKRVALDGILLLDKPVGLSSNDALIQSKRLLNAAKAGHTGTLDPFATGLLPLCFGEATKFTQDLLDADKTYDTVVHLGISTTTGDTEGEILATNAVNLTSEQARAVTDRFRGEILQVPPMHSALKRDGKPLYEYARAGITLEREARRVTIREIEVLDFQSPYLSLRVTCSKGTYIRVLGEDIGKALGCGAHLQQLRRIRVGELSLENSIRLDALAALAEENRTTVLLPVDSMLGSFPVIFLPDELARRFLHGQRLPLIKEGVAFTPDAGRVRVYREADKRLLGTAQVREFGILAPERLIAG
ncbi:tRNA pseudouridine(55) synthase TruB [Oxalobacteraceae bacterium R-40]|uniref:tRNA pseudouridine synthase B n=1 Tax=Keguizhuia sedimenti TaxID=3064264 RepID=A0ABU1BQ84_9BURK|nr:tRNA pseudouridine(55) synthase TruB [Oxalobacteraceae bacterium R-40]